MSTDTENHTHPQLPTDEQAEALARRLVACKTWRWMPGMLTLTSDDAAAAIVVRAWDGLLDVYGPDSLGYMEVVDVDDDSVLPDLRDPSTRGCVLQLVREAYGDPWIYIEASAADDESVSESFWLTSGLPTDVSGDTEAETLVRAMELAP